MLSTHCVQLVLSLLQLRHKIEQALIIKINYTLACRGGTVIVVSRVANNTWWGLNAISTTLNTLMLLACRALVRAVETLLLIKSLPHYPEMSERIENILQIQYPPTRFFSGEQDVQ